jgi:uncharacterized membrane protein YdbT with pleckstrin-like domain
MDSNLMPRERMIYLTRRHFALTLARPLAIALACAVIGAFFFHAESRIAGWVFFAFALIEVVHGVIVHLSSEFFVTNRRVVIKTGILTTKSWEFLLAKIEGIHIEQSLLGRLHGFGSIIVTGTGGSRDVFEGIAHPFELRQAIHEQIERRSRPTATSDESGSE